MTKCTKEIIYRLVYNEYKNKREKYGNAVFYLDSYNNFCFSFRLNDNQGITHYCALEKIIDKIVSYINEGFDKNLNSRIHRMSFDEFFILQHIKKPIEQLWHAAYLESEYYNDL